MANNRKNSNRKNRNQTLVRILAIALALLLVGGTVTSVLFSALGEEETPARDRHEVILEYSEDNQALHVTQRLVYHNRTSHALSAVVFNAAANVYRRETSLPYESGELEAAFPEGYMPGGIEMMSVRVGGEAASWGAQGENEGLIAVQCEIAPGEACTFEFEYYVLLSRSRAMIGLYDTDVRLDAFLLTPAVYFDDEYGGEFAAHDPLSYTHWLLTDAADLSVSLTVPENMLVAATGCETRIAAEDGRSVWMIEAENVRDFALAFGKRYRETTAESASGVTVRALANDRSGARAALKAAVRFIDLYEEWFGAFPVRQLDIVQSDCSVVLNAPGLIWLPSDVLDDGDRLSAALRTCLAQQYFGLYAYVEPDYDSWVSDVLSEYVGLMAVETLDGYDAFLTALNERVLDALNITVPGGLYISSPADAFSADDYDLVVRGRGTAVMHETRLAMGRDGLIAGLRTFCEMGQSGEILTEMNLVEAFDAATDGDWEAFITDWLFNIDDYVGQGIDFYE